MPLRPALPTIRLFPLDDLPGGSGSNTSFPVVGVVKELDSVFFAPVVGVAGLASALMVGVVLPRWSGGVACFCGGLRRAVGCNSQFAHAPWW